MRTTPFRTMIMKMESKSTFLSCIVILIIFTVSNTDSAASITVDINKPQIKNGEEVTIRCSVAGIDTSSFIYWLKKQGSVETQIGTNVLINDKFKSTGRYTAKVTEEAGNVIFYLTITDAQDEDGGSYGCYIPTQPATKTFKELTVLVPPTYVRLFSLADGADISTAVEYRAGQKVNSREGELRFFRCMVGPANPAPSVTITYAGVDETKIFKRDEKPVVIGDEVANRGLVVHTTQVNLTTTTQPIKITYEANTQEMTCRASVPMYMEVAISIQFVLQFAPRFACDHVVRAGLYYKNISIACSVRADPPLHYGHTKWFWKRNEFSNVTLNTGESKGRYTAKMIKGPLEDEHIVMLSIDHAVPQVFRSYTLTVMNDLGENTQEFLLEKDASAEVKGAACGISASLTMLITIVSLVLSKHL